MTFTTFYYKVSNLCREAEEQITDCYEENGKYTIRTENVIFTWNPKSLKMTVRWGNGHQAMATI